MNRRLSVNAALVATGLLLTGVSARAQVPSGGKLPTRWSKDVNPARVLPEYPRPQMTRTTWQNLNGSWDYGLTPSEATTPPAYTGKILVPFPLESSLSGIGSASKPNQRLWYRRSFTVPEGWKEQRVLLHFGAVNWDSTVMVNGKTVGAHQGGYDVFDFDISSFLKPGANELVVSVWNPLNTDNPTSQILGKQRKQSGGIFYTGATGIWQSVWLEPVPQTYIEGLKITPDIDNKVVRVSTRGTGTANQKVTVVAMEGKQEIARATGAPGVELRLPIANPHLWTPDDPHLYSLNVTLAKDAKTIDTVGSYFAMRKISLAKDAQGQNRLYLNNKFVLQIGALDQGYWPDGIYTAPTDAALRYDIDIAKKLGFNMLRKHAKVEPDRWYYWTDKLGMLVWQDMPQAFGDNFTDATKKQWLTEWHREINALYNHPSIIVWTPFNEGWGQHDTEAIVATTRKWDPTRLVNNASGWVDKGVGDIADTHAYPGPWSGKPEAKRAAVNGEFGGVTMRVDGHVWTTKDTFAYGAVLTKSWLTTKRFQDLMKKAYQLRDTQGTSAFVYTQITDVEQEINGLLTYDRAVIKVDPIIATAANRGKFLPLPPNPNPQLVATAEEEAQTWLFTTDKPADSWYAPIFNTGGWKSRPAPFGQGLGNIRTDWSSSDIWLRREVILPEEIPAKLSILARHDEDVEIYINGVLATTAKGYTDDYAELPMSEDARATLKPGKNIIAVHCHQTIGGQLIDVGIQKAD